MLLFQSESIRVKPILCLLFANANANTMQSCRNFDDYFICHKCEKIYRGLTEVFIASPFCD